MNCSLVTSESGNGICGTEGRYQEGNSGTEGRGSSHRKFARHSASAGGVSFHVSTLRKVNLRISTSRFVVHGVPEGIRPKGSWPRLLRSSVDFSRAIVGPLSSSFTRFQRREGLVLPETIVPVNLCLVRRLFSHLFTRPRQKGHRLPCIPARAPSSFLPSFPLFPSSSKSFPISFFPDAREAAEILEWLSSDFFHPMDTISMRDPRVND